MLWGVFLQVAIYASRIPTIVNAFVLYKNHRTNQRRRDMEFAKALFFCNDLKQTYKKKEMQIFSKYIYNI